MDEILYDNITPLTLNGDLTIENGTLRIGRSCRRSGQYYELQWKYSDKPEWESRVGTLTSIILSMLREILSITMEM